jgi:hypothetical protein
VIKTETNRKGMKKIWFVVAMVMMKIDYQDISDSFNTILPVSS